MKFIPLAILAASLLVPAARADKFHLGSPDAPKQVEGSDPDVIVGVLLSETDTHYVIRMVGGEIELDKKLVHKVEKDGLTVVAVEQAEKDRTDVLAQADAERQGAQAADREVAAIRRLRVQAAEASASRGDRGAVPVDATFDPVVGALPAVTVVSDALLMRDLEALYAQTGDRQVIKQLRRLRRAR